MSRTNLIDVLNQQKQEWAQIVQQPKEPKNIEGCYRFKDFSTTTVGVKKLRDGSWCVWINLPAGMDIAPDVVSKHRTFDAAYSTFRYQSQLLIAQNAALVPELSIKQ